MGTLALIVGGALCIALGWVDYGWAMFILFPCAVGFSLGTMEKSGSKQKLKDASIVLAAISLLFLAFGLEGIVCIILAYPLLFVMMLAGYLVAVHFFPNTDTEGGDKPMQATLAPLLVLLVFGQIEHWMSAPPEVATVTTALELPFSAEQVFDAVKEMDTLDAEKPMLLQIGLPTPYKCVLEADSVGAKRTCVFPDGRIVSQLTEFDRPNSFKMNVLEYSLTGLRWFRFESASYVLTQKRDMTQLSRTTSYSSTLKPRLYWQPLEIWAIEQEHQFVLESVKKNLMKQKAKQPAHD